MTKRPRTRFDEIRQLGRTLRRWREQIAAWHQAQVTNGPTETNGLIKRIKRVAFGTTNFVHWRIRVLLYAGHPDWSKLATVTPWSRSAPKGRFDAQQHYCCVASIIGFARPDVTAAVCGPLPGGSAPQGRGGSPVGVSSGP